MDGLESHLTYNTSLLASAQPKSLAQEEMGGGQETPDLVAALPLTCCVTWRKCLPLSGSLNPLYKV